MKKQFVTLLLSFLLMACERSELAPLPTQSGISAFRFSGSNKEVLYYDYGFADYPSRGVATIEAKKLTSSVGLTFDSVSYMADTITSSADRLFIYPHLYTLKANSAKRLYSVTQSGWHRSYIAALNDNFLVLAGEISGSKGDSLTNLEVYTLNDNSFAAGSIDLSNPKCVALQGDVAYVFDDNKLKVIELRQPSTPLVIKSIPISNVTHLSVAENKLIVTTGNQVQQFNIANPREPVLLATIR